MSYREDWCRAARAGREAGSDCFAPVPLAAAGPPPGPEDVQTLELGDLIRFLRLPAEWFLTRTLGLRTPNEEDAMEDVEPFVLDSLAGWGLRQRLLALADQDRPPAAARALALASGTLPHGAVADLMLDQAAVRVDAFRAELGDHAVDSRPPLEVDLAIGGMRLTGWIEGVTAAGLVTGRLGRQRAQDLLALWVRHLVLNHLAPAAVAPSSRLITEQQDKGTGAFELVVLELMPVPNAAAPLEDLIDLFQQGRLEPLPFYPETSRAFAEVGWDTRTWNSWEGAFTGPPGESAHWAIRTALRGRDPIDAAFEALARRVFGPVLAAIADDSD